MKFFVTIAIVLGLLLTPTASAQQSQPLVASNTVPAAPAPAAAAAKPAADVAPVPEPEWSGVVYQLVDGKLLPMEKQKQVTDVKKKMLGVGGASMSVLFTGKKSPTSTSPLPVFVVKIEGATKEPSMLINIDHLTVDEKTGGRGVLAGKVSLGGTHKKIADTGVELVFAKCGKDCIKFSPASPLASGDEFVVTTTASGEMAYLFNVN